MVKVTSFCAALSLIAIVLLFPACSPCPPSEQPIPRVIEPVASPGGVYYFPVVGQEYRAALSAFLEAHPELDCRYFGADDERMNGGVMAYSLIVGHTIVCTNSHDGKRRR